MIPSLLSPPVPASTLNELLGPLQPAVRHALERLVEVHHFAGGMPVFGCTQALRRIWALAEGQVALGHDRPNGEFCAEDQVDGPAWLDLASAWTGLPPPLAARCRGLCTLLSWPAAELEAHFGAHPALPRRLLGALAAQVQRQTRHTHERLHLDAAARFAQWLQRQIEASGGVGPARELRLRQRKRELAAQLGITPETLSRLMRAMSQAGLIEVDGYRLTVLDPERLARQAQQA